MSFEHITWQKVIGDRPGEDLAGYVQEVDVADLALVRNQEDPLFDDLAPRPRDDLSLRLGRHQLADLVGCLAPQTLRRGGLGPGPGGGGAVRLSGRGRRSGFDPLILDPP